jgi:hypothetical protein
MLFSLLLDNHAIRNKFQTAHLRFEERNALMDSRSGNRCGRQERLERRRNQNRPVYKINFLIVPVPIIRDGNELIKISYLIFLIKIVSFP